MREANLKATVRRPKTTKESKGKAAGHVYENLLNNRITIFTTDIWIPFFSSD